MLKGPHRSQVTLLSGFLIQFPGLCKVLRYAKAIAVHITQVKLCPRVTLLRGLAVPRDSLPQVPLYAGPIVVDVAHGGLCFCVSPPG